MFMDLLVDEISIMHYLLYMLLYVLICWFQFTIECVDLIENKYCNISRQVIFCHDKK